MITQYPYPGLTHTQLLSTQVPVQIMPSNATAIRRFGNNSAVGTTYELVDTLGAATPYMPTTAVSVEVVSNSANDTSAGTGARTVLITGLDANYNLATATVTLNGLTAVVAATQFTRIYRADVELVGTYGGTNAGTITVRQSGGGTAFIQIDAGFGKSFSSHFTVPAGYYGAITGANLSADTGKTIDVRVISRDNANVVTAPYHSTNIEQLFLGVGATMHFDYDPPILISPLTDVYIQSKVASGTASVSAEYWGWIAPI